MLILMLSLFFNDGFANGFWLRAPRPQERPLFDSPATAWITPIKESAEERQMLWDSQHILFYADRKTGDPPELFIMLLDGYRLPKSRPTIGWHYIDPPHSIPGSNQLRLSPLFIQQDNGSTVIVVDRRDYQDPEGEKEVAKKVGELGRSGIKRMRVLQRGAERKFCLYPPSAPDTLMLYWIADAELTLLFTYTNYTMVDLNAFTLGSPTNLIFSYAIDDDSYVWQQTVRHLLRTEFRDAVD
jgi:hypothetical protein